ncbi:MAG: hypothetical protein U0790_14890 [Isosphaeraceae bacterium]
MQASDGELYRDVVTIAVEVSKSGARVTRTRTPEKGEAQVSRAAVPERGPARLRDTVKAVRAWELGDFRKPSWTPPIM